MRNRLRRAVTLSLAVTWAACRTPPREVEPNAGPRLRNASELEIMTTGDSLPRPARFDRGPRYPVSLRNAGVTGQLVAALVIDTAGRVEPRSITFVEPSHPEFHQAVCEFLRKEARFVPRRSGGVARRTLVFMPFRFVLSSAPPLGPAPNVRAYETRARELPRDELVAELERHAHC